MHICNICQHILSCLQCLLVHAAENPLQADLILSAIYSGESAGADRDQPYPDRGRPEPAHVRGHQGMDIDSAAAHRIPRGTFSRPIPVQASLAPSHLGLLLLPFCCTVHTWPAAFPFCSCVSCIISRLLVPYYFDDFGSLIVT